MANDFENRIASGVGTARTDMYTTPSAVGKRSMIIGLELANITGSAITVDVAADYALIYDATDSTAKKVYVSQVAPPVEVHPFLIMGG